ncbi:MAG: hypothetical protein QGH45_09175 [Myxococcota bacterium]|jgi:hypothetical protein|nr:hypothetical protein [Myxococcota bacterium]
MTTLRRLILAITFAIPCLLWTGCLDLSGGWDFRIDYSDGYVAGDFDIEQFQGEFVGDGRIDTGSGASIEIEDGEIEGDEVSFRMSIDGTDLVLLVDADLDDGAEEMSGTALFLGEVGVFSADLR